MNKGLLDRVPEISRARGYRLYSRGGKRITDFYQEGGRALLGYRVPGMALSIKQALDKGIYPAFRSRYDSRLKKSLISLIGKDVFFSVFTDLRGLFSVTGNNIPEYFSSQISGKSDISFWHPFSGDSIESLLESFKFVIPVIPFPGSFSPQILLSFSEELSEGDPVSPVLLSPLIKVIYRMISLADTDPYAVWDDSSIILEKLWKRKGPYLIPVYRRDNHEKIFITLLDMGYLISPDYDVTSILPGEISEGEKDKFLKTVIKISGGNRA